MDKLIIVDYQEGAGGEFLARFISAHFGHTLEFNQQEHPSNLQKWLNSQSLINKNWDAVFPAFLQVFLELCNAQEVKEIAVPYHLYKWPHHIEAILRQVPGVRFVKINCNNYVDRVYADFQRKVLDQPIKEFSEMQFLLKNKERDFIKDKLAAFKQGQLTYKDIFPGGGPGLQTLPSNDVEIDYGDFFCNFDQTASAYEELCAKIDIPPDFVLLSALLERNKKNQRDLNEHLSKI